MRVLVVDDHSLFRDGIVSLLDAAGFDVVGQAGDGITAVQQAIKLKPELVLLDINMPDMSGLDVLKEIKFSLPETRVVMLTASDDDNLIANAVKAGADGYLLKHLKAPEFVQLLEGVKRGEAAITHKTMSFLMKQIADPVTKLKGDAVMLSQREIEIVRLLAEGSSNKSIGEQLSLSENTIKYHIKKILQKLNVQNRTEAVTYAIRNNLIDS